MPRSVGLRFVDFQNERGATATTPTDGGPGALREGLGLTRGENSFRRR